MYNTPNIFHRKDKKILNHISLEKLFKQRRALYEITIKVLF